MRDADQVGLNVLDSESHERVYVGLRRIDSTIHVVLSLEKGGDVDVSLSAKDAGEVAKALSTLAARAGAG